jgi:uncharacterized protein (TIGR02453 family)
MLQEKTLGFIKSLAKNNNKAWFDKHRDEYQAAKEDFEAFISALLEQMAKTEPAFAGQKAKDSIFRIFRDVRFSKDKTPYKAHLSAGLSRGGRKFPGAGYYIHIEPGKNMAGGGLWMPEAPLLKAVRQEIDYNFKEFKGIITKPAFKKLFNKVEGEQLKTLPQGYTADNPAIEYLKNKSFIVSHTFTDAEVTSKTFVKKTGDVFTSMKPFIDFMNRSVE